MNMKNMLKTICAAVAIIGFAGCASMGGGELVDGEGGAPGRLIIKNSSKNSNYDITQVLMSRCGGYTMGFNRLENREWIRVGQEKSFVMSPGCWDVAMGDGVSHQGSMKVNIVTGQEFTVDYK